MKICEMIDFRTLNPWVAGSIPAQPTKFNKRQIYIICLFHFKQNLQSCFRLFALIWRLRV